jgi:citrate lyase subunit beta/citryl-CoA lyase
VILTALYVPGDRPDRFAKAAASGADLVILDLEDAVAAESRGSAREAVVTWLQSHEAEVRVNAPGSDDLAADLAALRGVVTKIRLPKVESADDVDALVGALGRPVEVTALIETARGVEAAYDIARHPAVAGIGLGELDLRSDLGVDVDEALQWVRTRVVVAARAAGLPPPMQSVWTQLGDEAGLEASCRAGRSWGFRGRSAVHPRQIPVIMRGYRPSADEVAAARAVLAGLRGGGVSVLPSGAMIDEAVRRGAEDVLALEAATAASLERT